MRRAILSNKMFATNEEWKTSENSNEVKVHGWMSLFEERQIACKSISMFSYFENGFRQMNWARIFGSKWKSNINISKWILSMGIQRINMNHWALKCVLPNLFRQIEQYSIIYIRPTDINLNNDGKWTQFVFLFGTKSILMHEIFTFDMNLLSKSIWKISIFGISSFYRPNCNAAQRFIPICYNIVDWRAQTLPYFRVLLSLSNLPRKMPSLCLFDDFIQTIWLCISSVN